MPLPSWDETKGKRERERERQAIVKDSVNMLVTILEA